MPRLVLPSPDPCPKEEQHNHEQKAHPQTPLTALFPRHFLHFFHRTAQEVSSFTERIIHSVEHFCRVSDFIANVDCDILEQFHFLTQLSQSFVVLTFYVFCSSILGITLRGVRIVVVQR